MKKIILVLLCFLSAVSTPSSISVDTAEISPKVLYKIELMDYIKSLEDKNSTVKNYLTYENLDLFIQNSMKYPSIIVAMSIIESGWGKYPIGNNYFGIKGKGHKKLTKEWNGTKYITITSSFQQYDSKKENIKAVVGLLHNKRYSLGSAETYKKGVIQIAKGGYATCPTYSNKILKVIKDYNLTKLDEIKSLD